MMKLLKKNTIEFSDTSVNWISSLFIQIMALSLSLFVVWIFYLQFVDYYINYHGLIDSFFVRFFMYHAFLAFNLISIYYLSSTVKWLKINDNEIIFRTGCFIKIKVKNADILLVAKINASPYMAPKDIYVKGDELIMLKIKNKGNFYITKYIDEYSIVEERLMAINQNINAI